jgi:hypothetical protein
MLEGRDGDVIALADGRRREEGHDLAGVNPAEKDVRFPTKLLDSFPKRGISSFHRRAPFSSSEGRRFKNE